MSSEDPHGGLVLEVAENYQHACDLVLRWSEYLCQHDLHQDLAVYLRAEPGFGWCVKIASIRPDVIPLPFTRTIPRQAPSAEL